MYCKTTLIKKVFTQFQRKTSRTDWLQSNWNLMTLHRKKFCFKKNSIVLKQRGRVSSKKNRLNKVHKSKKEYLKTLHLKFRNELSFTNELKFRDESKFR